MESKFGSKRKWTYQFLCPAKHQFWRSYCSEITRKNCFCPKFADKLSRALSLSFVVPAVVVLISFRQSFVFEHRLSFFKQFPPFYFVSLLINKTCQVSLLFKESTRRRKEEEEGETGTDCLKVFRMKREREEPSHRVVLVSVWHLDCGHQLVCVFGDWFWSCCGNPLIRRQMTTMFSFV